MSSTRCGAAGGAEGPRGSAGLSCAWGAEPSGEMNGVLVLCSPAPLLGAAGPCLGTAAPSDVCVSSATALGTTSQLRLRGLQSRA